MLDTLLIKNFAIIENTSLKFDLGFNVLIGASGAGKSIVLDAISFVLGEKPNREMIRHGQNETLVKATFTNLSSEVVDKLKAFQIDADDDLLVVSRTFNVDGKSSCVINGEPVTVSMLRQVGILLYDIFGQNESIMVLNSKNHLAMLDAYDSVRIDEYKAKIKELLVEYKAINDKIDDLGGQGENRERVLDLLKYQIDEIQNSNLRIGEDEELENQIRIMSNFEKISNNLKQSYNLLSQDNVGAAISFLDNAKNYDSKLDDIYSRLKSVEIDLEDITSSINEYVSNISYSEAELDEMVSRLDNIKLLKKKYGSSIDDVLKFCDDAKVKYDELLNSEANLVKLEKEKSLLAKKLYDVSLELHNIRVKNGREIVSKIEQQLKELGMNNTSVGIDFKPVDNIDNCSFTTNGIDQIEFLLSANAGEQQKSLSKIISGGEMSRFMLALKNVLCSKEEGTLIFDEIDSGVSGEIGYKVGQKLYLLSKNTQVICITHLPQVTALADRCLLMSKSVINNITVSSSKVLNEEDLIEYLASLFGSYQSEAAITHAKELLAQAKAFKLNLNN